MKILATIAGNPSATPVRRNTPPWRNWDTKAPVYGLDFFILGPKEMDPAVAKQINTAFKNVLADPEVNAQFVKMRMPLTYMGFEESRQRLIEGDKKIGETTTMLA